MKYAAILAFAILTFAAPSGAQAHDEVACTMQYQPVCGTEKGSYKTYGNGCTLGAEGAVYQHEGECTSAELAGKQEGTYMPPAHCTAWNDGCNSCGRSTDGESMCTLMACLGTPRAGYCTAYGDTEPDVTPAPDASVSSGISAGITVTEPVPSMEATTTASTTESAEPGFFARIWHSIASWFSDLF